MATDASYSTISWVFTATSSFKSPYALPTELAPLNKTRLSTQIAAPWVNGPPTRGTFQILWTCTFALFICVYTAIHPNVPAPWDSFWSHNLRRTKWVLVAIFAPEAVVLTAWQQFLAARRFREAIRGVAEESQKIDAFVKTELVESSATESSSNTTDTRLSIALKSHQSRFGNSRTYGLSTTQHLTQQPQVRELSSTGNPDGDMENHAINESLELNVIHQTSQNDALEVQDDCRPQNSHSASGSLTRPTSGAEGDDRTHVPHVSVNGESGEVRGRTRGNPTGDQGAIDDQAESDRVNNVPSLDPESNHEQPTSQPVYEEMTMSSAFYAIMGGFVVDLSGLHNTRKIVTITPSGLVFLAKCGHFFSVPDKTINDKSKADTFAKIVIGIQVAYVVILVGARKAEGLPITLLELHVFVHVICAATMFLLWLKKPKDIMDPTVIDSTVIKTPLAWMVANNDWKQRYLDGTWRSALSSQQKEESIATEAQMLALYTNYTHTGHDRVGRLQDASAGPIQTPFSTPLLSHYGILTAEGRRVTIKYMPPGGKGIVCTLRNGETLRCGVGIRPSDDRPPIQYGLSIKDKTRLTLCATMLLTLMDFISVVDIINGRAATFERRPGPPDEGPTAHKRGPILQTTEVGQSVTEHGISDYIDGTRPTTSNNPQPDRLFQQVQPIDTMPWSLDRIHGVAHNSTYLLAPREPNFHEQWIGDLSERSQKLSEVYTLIAFTLLSTAYGGLHMQAFDFAFPTSIERFLWIAAAVSIMLGGVVLLLRTSLEALSLLITQSRVAGRILKKVTATLDHALKTSVDFYAIYYIGARLYLVIEAYVSIRRVPVGVYYLPSWVWNLPSFG